MIYKYITIPAVFIMFHSMGLQAGNGIVLISWLPSVCKVSVALPDG